ncbi:squalene/phytoene synthase family protein [Thalassococcus lentus]|uniref:Squalene/phytoene synthase family protein n=1 Tax=Thalassococcus lentus TaxID=1210524 RepID=A0ABT4XX91_9RHOB|nr:squalene/phytoene synthase family protein [Thalassococcus lentus]MDA7426507.1 squalene/phytoene synthase family protein [Thalassococcus lentus]
MSDPFADPDLIACAEIVQKGDPDRFRATMAAPVEARAVMFPIYAFNVEVARAPWITKEPLIAQMRLQWWADVLTEIETGSIVRRHSVATPLAGAINAGAAKELQSIVSAREIDLERAPFDDQPALNHYLENTAGTLCRVVATALDSRAKSLETELTTWGAAAGLARYLQAVPQLVALGKLPLPDGRPETISEMASSSLNTLEALGRNAKLRTLGKTLGASRPAVLEFWKTKAILRQAMKEPERVADGHLSTSGFGDRARLIWTAL